MTRTAAVLALSFALAACGSADQLDLSDDTASPTHAYTIPSGAGEAYDAGAPLEILPANLEVQVGDVIEIVNEDERGHLIGPFYVGAGETLRQRFNAAGEFIGECTVHPSGEIVVTVTE